MDLSRRQRQIMEYIRAFILDNGYPPTIRQIGEAVGISSTSVVNYNLNILQKAGYISRDRTVSRGIKLSEPVGKSRAVADIIAVPLLGRIAAGQPIPVPEGTFSGETVEVPRTLVLATNDLYALQVRGTSMIDAFINDGERGVHHAQAVLPRGQPRPAAARKQPDGSHLR
jgi:repressor LexA